MQQKDRERTVTRFKGGQLNDGANGEPAGQIFHANGKLFAVQHFKDGLLNDGDEMLVPARTALAARCCVV